MSNLFAYLRIKCRKYDSKYLFKDCYEEESRVMKTKPVNFLLALDIEPSPVNALPRLLEVFKKTGIPGTIFVTGQISKMVEPFLNVGWSIQTHTHPNLHPEFNGSYKLADYSYSSQLVMIQRDKETIEKTLNIKSIAFRAGKLSMNDPIQCCSQIRVRSIVAALSLMFST